LPTRVLGVNAVFHDPAAALVVDGQIVAAAEEERFTRRKHGKPPLAFSTWELPEDSARWCLRQGGIEPAELDAVAYSYDPACAEAPDGDITAPEWEPLRTLYVRRAPLFLRTALPGLDPERVRFVPHHVAHAASAYLASGFESCAVMTVDGRGESSSQLLGHARDGTLRTLSEQSLPHSLGLVYESLTAHLGFRQASDEYKVMALASYGAPAYLSELREVVQTTASGGFQAVAPDWSRFAPALEPGGDWTRAHADLAASMQRRLEEVLLDLALWLHDQTGERRLALAGGVALNCVANSRLWRDGPFDEVWVQPAAGDSGTALGAALYVAHELGESVQPMRTAALGRGWSDAELETELERAALPYERPDDVAETTAECWRATASWPGSRAAPSTAPGRSATAACWRTPATRRTSSGSTTSRAVSSSGPSRRWCSPTAPRRSSTAGRCRARTCCSLIAWRPPGESASRQWCTSTGPLACRPWTTARRRRWRRCCARSSAARACRWW
jgi:carbamoyltransferase